MIDGSTGPGAGPPAGPGHRPPGPGVWQQFRRHKGAVAGAAVFSLLGLAVLLGSAVYGVDPQYLDYMARNRGMSPTHPMGTDNLGRDMLARVLAGGQISLAVGVAAMVVSLTLGTFVGVMAGYFRRLDGPLMRLTDLHLALPVVPLLLVGIMLFRDPLRAALGPEVGIFILVVTVIGMTNWMQAARVVRGEVLAVKEREFVLAARSVGAPSHRIILWHVLPNALSPITVAATLGIANAIIIESSLSFLGLGFPSDFPTWGRLLYDGVPFLQITPARVIWPGLAISLTVLSVNYMGDGLRDALDPRVRRH